MYKHRLNTTLILIQYKWLFKTCGTPVKLSHYNPNISDNCSKCDDNVGPLLYCTWECQKNPVVLDRQSQPGLTYISYRDLS